MNRYLLDIKKSIELDTKLDASKLLNKTILISGATGLIGSAIVDYLMTLNDTKKLNIKVVANGFNQENLDSRFKYYYDNSNFTGFVGDVNEEINVKDVDYVIHCASNANPARFKSDPVGTLLSNVIGTKNLLDCLNKSDKNNKKFIYISSGEIYGVQQEEKNELFENDYGYCDILQARSCYPIGKRAGETLCVSYSSQYNLDCSIVRPCHVYGPTANKSDDRITNAFMRNVIAGNDIVLKSSGKQMRSYCHVVDCASAIIHILTSGVNCEAYNISNPDSIVSIRNLSEIIANKKSKKVLFENNSENKDGNFNPMDLAILNSNKLLDLGWKPIFNIEDGISNTIEILEEIINDA